MISLAEHNPELLDEWDYKKNELLGKTPETISYGTDFKTWWKCKKCGYEWKACTSSRTTTGCGCPVCGNKIVVEGYNDIKTLYPELMKEWDYEKNEIEGLYPNKLPKRSDKRAWWICPICNNSYKALIHNRTNGTGCPKCANEIRTSFPEQVIYYYLKEELGNIATIENRFNLIGKELDVYIPEMQIGIEYDGVYFHNTKASLEREKNKYEHCKDVGITLIRIREKNLNLPSYADYTINLYKRNNDQEYERMIYEIFQIIGKLYRVDYSNYKINMSEDRQKIYNQYIQQRKDNSIIKLYPKEIKDWDYEKNQIKPESLTVGSERKVWWKCEKGHSYEQRVYSHIKGASCPYCSGLKIIVGENDLETKYPEIAKEWDYSKNKIKPNEVKNASDQKCWWICPKGHSYQSSVSHRTGNQKEKCPICIGKKILIGYNDLKSQRPELMKEWDYKKNKIGPEKYTVGSMKQVWWICPKGHSYKTEIHSRANLKTKCSICNGKEILKGYNDLESQKPELMKEWDYTKNDKLGLYPDKIHVRSHVKVWWKCKDCGYEWNTSIESRSRGSNCIKCSNKKSGLTRTDLFVKQRGSVADKCPELIKEWDYEKNEFGPEKYTCGSSKRVWWKCSKCGQEWETMVHVRTNMKCGCPKCKNKKISK